MIIVAMVSIVVLPLATAGAGYCLGRHTGRKEEYRRWLRSLGKPLGRTEKYTHTGAVGMPRIGNK